MTTQDYYHVTSRYRCMDCVNMLNSDLYVSICGIENCSPGKKFGPGRRADYHIHFILGGKGTLRIENQTWQLSAGQIFVLPENQEVEYQADADDPWQYAWIAVGGRNALRCLKNAGFEDSWLRECNCNPNCFVEIIDKILGMTELTLVNELRRNSYMHEILALLAETRTAKRDVRHEFSPDLYVQYAVQFIHLNYSHIRVNDIAKYIGINRSYLTTIFKNKLNVSPQEYLVSYRLNKGKQLLCTTDLSIQEIAAAVGYDNPLTFSKMFKNAYGKSPRHYRQEAEETREQADRTGNQTKLPLSSTSGR